MNKLPKLSEHAIQAGFLGVRNAYARDWLESRLQANVERLLAGILKAQVNVRFLVAAVGEDGSDDQ